ncbi:sex peptide receptor-related protein 2-like [Mytilus galloprovincialis]|uniref:G-protein coupled receptors family 1 profile domain-containing protein n=2 Tax=Mytilus galloprovincialis TaxID=29158 RepID=A0A8B6HSF1_MYTGA|nr:Hypothetical predicted protein [Mytilus galloprovincialis]
MNFSEDYGFINATPYNPCYVIINSTHVYDICGEQPIRPCILGNESKIYSNSTLPEYNNSVVIRTLFLVILVPAILGIILTIIVLSRKHMCTSTNCYLISLSVADLGFLILLSTKWLETEVSDYLTFDIYYRYAQIFIDTFLMASIWITVMLAIERYIAICHSLRANVICTVRRAVIINAAVFFISFACRIPNFFEYSIKTGWSEYECIDKKYIDWTRLGRNTNYKIVYAWVFDCILCATVPFLALVYLNMRLILEIRKSTHYLMDTLGNDSNLSNVLGREQRRVTLMLISIVIVFFICQAPYVSISAYQSIKRYSMAGLTFHAINTGRDITIFLLAFKSALNFILYCWFSEKFWDTFKKELCRKVCIFFKRNRDMFSSRTNSDTHHNSTHNKSLRKSSAPAVKEVSVQMRDVHS